MAFRILSLDGGGSWALIQVKALIALYGAMTGGHEVLNDFDMAVATSGGSIVLGGLLENLTLQGLLGYFQDGDKRRSIFFPTKSVFDKTVEATLHIGPKYSATHKLVALQTLLPARGGQPLSSVASGLGRRGSSGIRLLIVAFDYDRNRAVFFRSAAASAQGWGEGEEAPNTVTLADAIHASTNAPIDYFDAAACFPGRPERYWDGGVSGFNNPVLAAVTEALVLRQAPADIAALSIGTGSVALPWPVVGDGDSQYVRRPSKTGLVPDLKKLATAILDDPPDAASFIAHTMTGGPAGLRPPLDSRIVRMNPLIAPVRDRSTQLWTAPAGMQAAQFCHLRDLDMDAVEQLDVDLIGSFADSWIRDEVMNQPIRMDSDTLQKEIGSTTFGDAVRSWQMLR